MKVKVHLFGHYRDVMAEATEIEIPSGATIGDLAVVLASQDGRLANVQQHCRAAVNEEYAPMTAALTEGDEVAFIPPMSGG